jgi:hypothetical protein
MALNINYVRDVYTYEYKSYGDVISYVGGLKGAIQPFFNILTPIIVLVFLITLSGILKKDYKNKYQDLLMKSIQEFSSNIVINDKNRRRMTELKAYNETILGMSSKDMPIDSYTDILTEQWKFIVLILKK